MRNIFSTKPEKIGENDNDIPMQTLHISGKHLGLPRVLWLMIISHLSASDLNILISINHYFGCLARESICIRASFPLDRLSKFFNIRLALIRILMREIRNSDTDAALNNSIFQENVFNKIPIKMLTEWPKEEAKKLGDFFLFMQEGLRNPEVLNYIYSDVKFILELLKEKGMEEVKLHIHNFFRMRENRAWAYAAMAMHP